MEKIRRFLRSIPSLFFKFLSILSKLIILIGAAFIPAVRSNTDTILELLPSSFKEKPEFVISGILVIIGLSVVYYIVEEWNKQKEADKSHNSEQGTVDKLVNWVKNHRVATLAVVILISSAVYFSIPKPFPVVSAFQNPSLVQDSRSSVAPPLVEEPPSVVQPSPTATPPSPTLPSSTTPLPQELPKEINTSRFIRIITVAFLLLLILSLLTSEIQDLLSIIFQWKAAHLKKSIETLLTGGEGTANDESVKRIVESIYSNPLIRNISHESKEGIESWLRKMTHFVITLGRKGKLTLRGNEPSYIPSETFATILLEKLSLSQLAKKMTALNLKRIVREEVLDQLDGYLIQQDLQIKDETRQDLTADLSALRQNLEAICTDFSTERATLLTCVNRLRDELNSLIETTKLLAPTNALMSQDDTSTERQGDPEVVKFVSQLKSLKNGIFYQGNPDSNNTSYNNTDELIRRLQPSLAQILDLGIGEVTWQQQVLHVSDTYKLLQDQFGNLDPNDEIYLAYQEIRKDVEAIGRKLPTSARESLAILSRSAQINVKRTQIQVQAVEDELYQFKSEIQIWFDRSMESAFEVYKRNARGSNFLIGFTIAIILNIDSFHIAGYSTKQTEQPIAAQNIDKSMSQTNGAQVRNSDQSGTENIETQTVEEMFLPIGWGEVNATVQQNASNEWGWLSPFRYILGWLVSSILIVIGALVWHQFFHKFRN